MDDMLVSRLLSSPAIMHELSAFLSNAEGHPIEAVGKNGEIEITDLESGEFFNYSEVISDEPLNDNDNSGNIYCWPSIYCSWGSYECNYLPYPIGKK